MYELVVRRFLATCAEPAEWEYLRVTAEANDCQLKANGKRLLDPGYLAVYPYVSSDETLVPDVDEGSELALADTRLEAKQTQPPRRRGQSRLIEELEARGVGTKSTRHNTIEKLYDRGYIENDPPRPTRLAMAVVEAAEAFAEQVVDEEMTRQLEQDMTAIADGEATLDDVTDESRAMLGRVFDELHDSREAVGEQLREALKDDKRLGPCPECGETLIVRRSRRGSYFVGCEGFPECEHTLPLPSTGKPLLLEETCEEHGLHHIKMLAGRKTFVHGCPLCKAEAAAAHEDEVIGDCPGCGEAHGGDLAVKQLQSGSRLVGCTRYPDCDYSLPLPRRGDIEVLEERCPEHDLPDLVVHDGDDDPWELGCPICNYEEFQERRATRDLDDLDGVGEKTAAKLAEADIESLSDLEAADPEGVADRVSGVSADRVRDWQDQVEGAS